MAGRGVAVGGQTRQMFGANRKHAAKARTECARAVACVCVSSQRLLTQAAAQRWSKVGAICFVPAMGGWPCISRFQLQLWRQRPRAERGLRVGPPSGRHTQRPCGAVLRVCAVCASASSASLCLRRPPFPTSTMIRGLRDLLHERGLVKTAPIDALRGTRLGIDLGEWVRALLAAHPEPLTAAVGGLPLALQAHLTKHIETLVHMHIRPIFVIEGLTPAESHPPFSTEDTRLADRARAWSLYEADQLDHATEAFGRCDSIPPPDLMRPMIKALRIRNLSFVNAPFLAAPQLAYMERHHRGFVHSMYGNEMLLLFDGVERVITSIDLDARTFTFVSKAEILSELKCNADDFLDACILSGFEHCRTFPPLLDGSVTLRSPGGDPATNGPSASSSGAPVNPLTVVQLVKQHRGGYATVTALSAPPRTPNVQYLDAFCRARALVKFSLVLADDGKLLPLPLAVNAAQSKLRGVNGSATGQGSAPSVIHLGNGMLAGQKGRGAPEVPADLHDVFFYRLPDDVFTYLCRGLIGTQIYHSLLSGQRVELEPLEGGSLPEFQRFVRETLIETPQSPHATSLALAASHLAEFWKTRPVTAVYWFDPSRAYEIKWKSNETQAMLACVSRWNVPGSTISRALTEQQYSRIDLLLCLGATRTPEGAQATITPRMPSQHPLERKDEVAVNTRWRLLELRGFINHEHLHTAFGRALYHAVRNVHVNDPQEPLYIALELIRAGVLHGRFYNNDTAVFSGGPSLEYIEGVEATAVQDNRSLLLVMRALSLIPMVLLAQPWDAPLSRELLAFHAFARALTSSLRSLGETLACEMLLSGAASCKEDDLVLSIALSLPFTKNIPNTGLGVIVKCYVEGLLTYLGTTADEASADDLDEAKSTLVLMLQQNFKEIRDVKLELIRGFRFWGALVLAVRLLGQEGALEPGLVAEFDTADKWLKPIMIK